MDREAGEKGRVGGSSRMMSEVEGEGLQLLGRR